uniref:Pre-rRNA-processing protein ESF1 n=1 Tax=Rhizophora mucronata TaxID=61149 RepID=A0A2P2L9E6_RHIMU
MFKLSLASTQLPTGYEGLDFHTKALQHSSIPISWDEDEPQRVKTLKRKFNADQLAELELKEFLASDESESENYENDDATEDKSDKKPKKQDKYRALIQSDDGSDGDGEEEGQDMEITFNTGLEEISKRILEKRDKGPETVWEAELRKKREKRKACKNISKNSMEDESGGDDEEGTEQADDFFVEEPSVKKGKKKDARGKGDKDKHTKDLEAEASRAELELLVADDNGNNNGLRGYNLKPIKAKGKGGKEVLDEEKLPTVDYDDARFSALFTSPLFAMDPTDPQFKRSAAYARQVAQRQHKVNQQEVEGEEHRKVTAKAQLLSDVPITSKDEVANSDRLPSNKKKHELSSLLRSIKTKSKQVQSPSIGKKPKKEANSQPRKKDGMLKPELLNLVQSVKKKAQA